MHNAALHMVKLGEYELAANTFGANDPELPPVVFINALGVEASEWANVTRLLQPGPRLITYDRSNIGASPPRPVHLRYTTYQGYAVELSDLLTAMDVTGPVVLVAHSVGSFIARLFAASWPDKVAGVVHVDGSVHDIIVRTLEDAYEGVVSTESTVIDHFAGGVELDAAELHPVRSVVLVQTPGRSPAHKVPDIDEIRDAAARTLAEQLQACRIDAVDSGHHMQRDAPNLVAFAVKAVLTAWVDGESHVRVDPEAAAAVGGAVVQLPA